MRRLIFPWAIWGGCALLSCAAPKPASSSRILVAAIPFDYKAGVPEYSGIASGLADSLASECAKTGIFRMIERGRTDALLREMNLQMSGVTDPAHSAQLGKQLGAQALLVGSIASVSVRDEFRSVKFAEKTVRFADVEAQVNLVDVQTGEILASGRAIGKADSAEKHAFGAQAGELAGKESVLQKAVQDLADRLARDLAKTYHR